MIPALTSLSLQGSMIQNQDSVPGNLANTTENSNPKTTFSHLPLELLYSILSHMDSRTLKSSRLACKSLSYHGAPYLYPPTLHTLPYQPTSPRLLCISSNPQFSPCIQTLHFNHSELNEYHARHNTYFLEYLRGPEDRSSSVESAWSSYNQLKPLIEEFLPQACDEDVLTAVFKALRNMKEVKVVLMECPFDNELLKSIWKIPSTRLLPRVATTERFTAVFTALSRSHCLLKALSHDRLPFEFFAQKPRVMEMVQPGFEHLETLDLSLDYSERPNSLHTGLAFGNLIGCLKTAVGLRDLRLGFLTKGKMDLDFFLEALSSSSAPSSFSSAELFSPTPTTVFLQLTHLTLFSTTSSEVLLSSFLLSLPALLTLKLGSEGVKAPYEPMTGGIWLKTGSFRHLFEGLRAAWQREGREVEIRLRGDLMGVESGEKWLLEQEEGVDGLREYVID
ncbi:hypothetical protein B7494_g417 [Chlorociboria aeruginascens]|nr:hypothetical protein B7494_g417 [Chlorociboria aeruginascens]